MIVVSNASPLISLAKIGQLEILGSLFSVIHISEQVFAEAATSGSGSFEISKAGWIHTLSLKDSGYYEDLRARYFLGAGELSTIALAKQLSADLAIIDEQAANAEKIIYFCVEAAAATERGSSHPR